MDEEELYRKVFKSKDRQQGHNSFISKLLGKVVDFKTDSRFDVTKRILRKQRIECRSKILDVGCWGGEGLMQIDAFKLYKDLYGVDLFDESVEKTKRLGVKVFKVNLNYQRLPFDQGYFDSVVCLAVIEHVFDPYLLVEEMSRVLKPGGLIVISFPNVAIITNRIRLLFGRLPVTSIGQGWDGGHLHYFTLHEIVSLLKRYDIITLERHATYGLASLRKLWLPGLCGEIVVEGKKYS